MAKPVELTPEYRDRMAAYINARRLGGSMAREIDRIRIELLRTLPANPTASDWLQFADMSKTAMAVIRRRVPMILKRGLILFAKRYHYRAAKILTAKTRHLQPKQEDSSDYNRLIIDPPSESELERIAGNAPETLSTWIDAEAISDVVRRGISLSRTTAEITRDIEDVFGANKVTSRRLARTEGLRVATQSQLAVSETIPDLVVGYQINAVDDGHSPTSRIEHKKRHGWIYRREPKGNQKSMADMPQPPIEGDGTIAYNCRCFLVPVIRGDDLDK